DVGTGRAAERGQDEVADVGPDHEDLAVGEVQELQDPVHHRVAEREQRVQAPERQPGDELTAEVVPGQREGVEAGEELEAAHPPAKRLTRTCGPPRWRAARRVETGLARLFELVAVVVLDLDDRAAYAARQ